MCVKVVAVHPIFTAILVFATLALNLSAQPQALDGTVEVTVDRAISGGREAVFNVDVAALPSTSLAQVVSQLEAVGVRAEHLRSVRFSGSQQFPQFEAVVVAAVNYSFEVRVPAVRLEAVSLEMDRFFRKPPAPILEFRYSGQLALSGAAVEAGRLAILPAMFEEARAKAEATFAAIGQTPGPIVALQDELVLNYGTSASARLSLRMARVSPAASGASTFGRSVATTVSRSLTVPYDVAQIGLSTYAGAETALRLLSPLGITAADIVVQELGSEQYGDPFFAQGPGARTSFYLKRPAGEFGRFVEGIGKLSPEARESLRLSFNGTLDYSPALRAREREKAIAALLDEARRRADSLARLLNLPLGNPRNISDGQPATSGVLTFASYVPFTPAHIGLSVEFAVD